MASTAWSVLSSSPRSKWNLDYLVRQRVFPQTSLFVLLVQSAEVEKLLSFQKKGGCLCLGETSKKFIPALPSELVTGTAFACQDLFACS